jgi:beta-glucosidase-like glycosyl hydrolase
MFASLPSRQVQVLVLSTFLVTFLCARPGYTDTNSPPAPAAAAPPMSLLAQLKSVRSLLEQADHDYKGHRANAVRELTYAIRSLETAKTKNSPLTPQQKAARAAAKQAKIAAKEAAAANPNREPQQASDAQLRSALAVLTQLSGQIGNVPATSKLQGHLRNAVAELNTALSIK